MAEKDEQENIKWCPSSKPSRPEAVVLGVHVDGGSLTYLDAPVPAAEATALIPDDISPTRVLRFAGHCYESCKQRIGDSCGLVTKVAAHAPAVDDDSPLPRCHLRPKCKWWEQAGIEACRRCPLVVHEVYVDDELGMRIANPNVPVDEVRPPGGVIAERSQQETG